MASTRPRRRRTVRADCYFEPIAPGPIKLTPEEEAENAATQALLAAHSAVVDCGKVAPLNETIEIAMEALAFKAGNQGLDPLRRRIAEVKAELMGMTWEG